MNGGNHGFDKSAPIVSDALGREGDLEVTLTDDKSLLTSPELSLYNAIVLGTGFTRRERSPDGTSKLVNDLTDEQGAGLLQAVREGAGFIGIHGTAWWIGGEYVKLVGGHANWHPPGLEFTVQIDDSAHAITSGIDPFTVQDEIYMSAWDPAIHVLASATWADKQHPVAWTHSYGQGRVFYTALGHGPSTFENPTFQNLMVNAARWVAAS